jgi:hypothetical protein
LSTKRGEKRNSGQELWYKSVISILEEDKEEELRQEDYKFKASLGY